MIDWHLAQTRLTNAGYPTGGIDGKPGRMTFSALLAYEARRQPDATIQALGIAAAMPDIGLTRYGLSDTPQRLAEFIAQTATESSAFTRFEENLRYSAKRLMAVWPSRFPTIAAALPYAWDASDADAEDKALANLVYGARLGNEKNGRSDDDGWNYRGRGMLQLTGFFNYAFFGPRVGADLIAHPDLASDPAVSLRIACEFWKYYKTNDYVDRGDFYGARGITNTGTPQPRQKPIALDEVAARRSHLLTVLA